jgi:zinc transporter, ZIP family
MANVGPSIGWGLSVALSLLAGALVAATFRLPERVAATVTAFGGGVLLAAVALELVPDADAEADVALTAIGLIAGTLIYVGADAWLNQRESSRMLRRAAHAAAAGQPMELPPEMMRPAAHAAAAGQPMDLPPEIMRRRVETPAPTADAKPGAVAVATEPTTATDGEAARGLSIAAGIFIDGVPESLALGLTIAEGELGVALLAGILVGNVVESYGAAQPMIAGGRSKRFAVVTLGALGLSLALATFLGGTVLADASPELIGTAEAIAAGAVLAVVSIAVIPHAFEEVSSLVATATVLGFVSGYLLS